jgi:hypothetical protein
MQGTQLSDGGAVNFYRQAVAGGAAHLEVMVTLTARLAAKDWMKSLPYFMSHDWLCIGSDDAHVAVSHFPEGHFEIHYTTRQRQKADVFRSPDLHETERRIDSFVVRGLMTHEIEIPDTTVG